MRPVTIWDIDDTLVDTRHRLHHIQCTQPDWHAFDAAMPYDTILLPGLIIYNALKQAGLEPVLFTSRAEHTRKQTQVTLNTLKVLGYRQLFMRGNDDKRSSVQVKKDMLAILRSQGCTPVMAFEDHPEVVSMFRHQGVPCWAADDRCWQQGWKKGLTEGTMQFERKPGDYAREGTHILNKQILEAVKPYSGFDPVNDYPEHGDQP